MRLYANYYANCIFLFHETINYLSRSHALSTFSRLPHLTHAAYSGADDVKLLYVRIISPFERTSKSSRRVTVSQPSTIKWLMRQLIRLGEITSLCDQTVFYSFGFGIFPSIKFYLMYVTSRSALILAWDQ